jgi:hypothetical protein
MRQTQRAWMCAGIVASVAGAALAQPYDADWYTVDAGGGYSSGSTPNGFAEVTGTIGQPDASDELTNMDGYSVFGGYWAVTGPFPSCLDVDFNNNGVFPEDQDIIDLFTVLAGGACPTVECDSVDFNGNGVFPEDQDIIDYFNVLAGGSCA